MKNLFASLFLFVAAFTANAAGLSLPDYETITLENGTKVLLLRKPDVPMVAARVLVRGGALADAPGKEGSASLLADLLGKGAGSRDALAFANAAESVGGEISFAADPDRQFLDLVFLEEGHRHMGPGEWPAGDGVTTMHHFVHRQPVVRADRVERARGARFGQADHPLAQIAAVDHLHRVGTVAGHQDLATLRDAVRPVGESIGFVAWADDVAGPHDGDLLAELPARLGLAQRLERSVEIFDVGAQRFLRLGHRVLAVVLRHRRVLDDAGPRTIGVHRYRRNEEVMPDLARQHLGRVAHPER